MEVTGRTHDRHLKIDVAIVLLLGDKASAASFYCTHHMRAQPRSNFSHEDPPRSRHIRFWCLHVTSHGSAAFTHTHWSTTRFSACGSAPIAHLRCPCLAAFDRLVGFAGACALRFGALLAQSLLISPALSLACGGGGPRKPPLHDSPSETCKLGPITTDR